MGLSLVGLMNYDMIMFYLSLIYFILRVDVSFC